MAEDRDRFIHQLEDIADALSNTPRRELQILLRRAAIRLRNVDDINLPPDLEEAVTGLATSMGKSKNDTVRIILREWLTGNGYLPSRASEEDSEPDGAA